MLEACMTMPLRASTTSLRMSRPSWPHHWRNRWSDGPKTRSGPVFVDVLFEFRSCFTYVLWLDVFIHSTATNLLLGILHLHMHILLEPSHNNQTAASVESVMSLVHHVSIQECHQLIMLQLIAIVAIPHFSRHRAILARKPCRT